MKLSPTNKARLVALIICVFLLIVTLLTDKCNGPTKEQKATFTHIYVTVFDRGSVRASDELLEIMDMDRDHTITMNDALLYSHKALAKSTDYAAQDGTITKLWGVENAAYRLYVNNTEVTDLMTPIAELDEIALRIEEIGSGTETELLFDPLVCKAAKEEEHTLALYSERDGERTPLGHHAVLVDGEDTGLVTNERGEVTLSFPYAATYVITAGEEECTDALCLFIVG